MQWVVTNAPPNSIVLFTFSATQNAYGKPVNRPERVRALLGDVVPDDLAKEDCEKEKLPLTLVALEWGRLVGFFQQRARSLRQELWFQSRAGKVSLRRSSKLLQ